MSNLSNRLFRAYSRVSLVTQIAIGLVAGCLLAWLSPQTANSVSLLGDLFVAGLKAVAPVLVFVLVTASLANHKRGQPTHIRPILGLYALGTLSAAVVAVIASTLFPTHLTLISQANDVVPPSGVGAVLHTLLFNIVDNPVHAVIEGNFIGILAWAIGLGIAFRHARESTRDLIADIAEGVTLIVKVVIRFAPLGIFGLVAGTLASLLATRGSFGIVGDVVIGIVGALIIGYVLPTVGLSFGGGLIGAVILATIGSVATLGVLRKLKTA